MKLIPSYSKIDTGDRLKESYSAIDFTILFHYSLWLKTQDQETGGRKTVRNRYSHSFLGIFPLGVGVGPKNGLSKIAACDVSRIIVGGWSASGSSHMARDSHRIAFITVHPSLLFTLSCLSHLCNSATLPDLQSSLTKDQNHSHSPCVSSAEPSLWLSLLQYEFCSR